MWIEPIGFKAPTFVSDAKSVSFVRDVKQSFGLLCQAQGFPVPFFRYEIINHKTISRLTHNTFRESYSKIYGKIYLKT